MCSIVHRYSPLQSSPTKKVDAFFSTNDHVNTALRYIMFIILTVYCAASLCFFVSSLCQAQLLHTPVFFNTVTNDYGDAAVESKNSVWDFHTSAASELFSKCHRSMVCCKCTKLY